MDNRYFIICDSEPVYSQQLAENLSKKMIDFQIHVCSSLEQVQKLQENGTIHILLVEDRFPKEEREKIEAKYRFVLTQRMEQQKDEHENPVYKYQSSDHIFEEIMKECLKQDETIFYGQSCKGGQLIGVYSPIGRIGKTTFAVELGKEIAKKEKVLYLNLETYSGWKERFLLEGAASLEDLLYYAKQETGNIGIRMEMMIQHFDDLDYIPPLSVSEDLKAVSFEEWENFFEVLLKQSPYQKIIIDFSESVQGLWKLLQMCATIYFPVCEDEESKAKIQQFEDNLKLLGYEELLERINKVEIEKDVDNFVKRLIKKEEKRCDTGRAAS